MAEEVEGNLQEMAATTIQMMEGSNVEAHPYAFHVSGPRNLSSPNWRDIISSTWKDGNYKRTVMACFIQAAYLLELDRQENRTAENALAPKWWLPFKYKLTKTLIDERDGSIFGAILEWDRSAALADFILIRPSGAPKAVLALRGTLLKSVTIRRDLTDDLRFLAWESLKGSVRFKVAFDALKSIADKYGSGNVSIVGHSLGAGFALQVGKTLAKEGIYVEAHLFNPPSVSLAMSLKNLGEKAVFGWKRIRSMLPSGSEIQTISDDQNNAANVALKKWVPHLYVNNSDYVCCYYADPTGKGEEIHSGSKENVAPVSNAASAAAKLFVLSKGNQKFLDAHKLEQWWADDLELQTVINNSKLISRQLKSLYQLPASQQAPAVKPR
ncbi:GDSL esterase/lipase At4g10955 [Beta vulgaris subsp. vulgaris]|uniref:GDSL esterase/lipase At4g10955 n=1 Tax=Beta vulgaris subsp. vulgaris TaxID=3555 RepID=UPI0020374D5C|nr:GDSL esterase/lipase At4g10955 [Beta vulgaris subsp. vulgaris]